MADRIKVVTDVLHEVAHDLAGMRDDVYESAHMLARMNTSREAGGDLRLNWNHTLPDRTRVSGRNVRDYANSLRNALSEFGNEIDALSNMVTRAARDFEQAESDNADIFEGLDGSGYADYEANSGLWDAAGQTGGADWIYDADSEADDRDKGLFWDASMQAAPGFIEPNTVTSALFVAAGQVRQNAAKRGSARRQQRAANAEKKYQQYRLHDAAMANAVRLAVNQHRSEWDGADKKKRMEIVERSVRQINAIQGTHVEFRRDLLARLRYFNTDMVGEYRRNENTITIDPDRVENGRYIAVMSTIVHEMRHAYQHSVVSGQNEAEVPESVRRGWARNFAVYQDGPEPGAGNYDTLLQQYMRQPLELDAYSWERTVVLSGLDFSSEIEGLQACAEYLENTRADIMGESVAGDDISGKDLAGAGDALPGADAVGADGTQADIADKDIAGAGDALPGADAVGADGAQADIAGKDIAGKNASAAESAGEGLNAAIDNNKDMK